MRKILAVEAIAYRQGVRLRGATPMLAGVPRRAFDNLLVRVEAEGGLVGWGECFALYDSWTIVREMLRRIVGPGAIGLDALEPGATTAAIQRRFHGLGGSGPFQHAISGLEIALWDIAGKAAGAARASVARRRGDPLRPGLCQPAALRRAGCGGGGHRGSAAARVRGHQSA